MNKKTAFIALITIFFVSIAAADFTGAVLYSPAELADAFAGNNLYINADVMASQQLTVDEYLVKLDGNVSVVIGPCQYRSDNAIVRIKSVSTEYLGKIIYDYDVMVYLQGQVKSTKTKLAKSIDIVEKSAYQGSALAVRFMVTGDVYATAPEISKLEISSTPEYRKATVILDTISSNRPKTVIQADAAVPKIETITDPGKIQVASVIAGKIVPAQKKTPTGKILPSSSKSQQPDQGIFSKMLGIKPKTTPANNIAKSDSKEQAVKFRYPVNISGVGSKPLKFDSEKVQTQEGLSAATVRGRFYLWHKTDEDTTLELLADNAVVFYAGDQVKFGSDTGDENLDIAGPIKSIYLLGNVEMTEGSKSIRSEQMYYDFHNKAGLAVKAVMKRFDEKRGVPLYLRAESLKILSETQFVAEDVLVTTSEFYEPQVKMTVSRVIVVDETDVQAKEAGTADSKYEMEMQKVKLSIGKFPFFYWPKITSDMQSPDWPIKSIHVGSDSDFGTSIETKFHLSRLLGLKQPQGVKSTLSLDYYSERGVGAGVDIEYKGLDYFGDITGYVINDRGEDDLGRADDRKDLEPDRDLRGRFQFRHREYLPYDWQLTTEFSYASDKNFVESFYRKEFDTGKERETLIHLKRSRENWALSFLAKARINDFENTLEELPTIEYHLTGQSLFDDRATLYSDTRISRLRDRYEADSAEDISGAAMYSQDAYTFGYHRSELDFPMMLKCKTKFVPYVAGTLGYEDKTEYNVNLGGATTSGENEVFVGEIGFRAANKFWKVDPAVRSRFWDLTGIRHIIKPHVEGVLYAASDDESDQRNLINFGLTQRWQTKRGDDKHIVDWMKLAINATFVNDDLKTSEGPDKYIWNMPYQPMASRRNMDGYGITRDKINTDYFWQITDTTSLLSDASYDIDRGTFDQFNIGISHFRYPDLSYYIGSRYLNHVAVEGEKGSHAVLYAITYKLNNRYTMVFSQEYNFDYGKSVQSELSLIRKYHRVCYALTVNIDSSLERNGIMFSVWPQGVRDLAMGSRKYVGMAGVAELE